MTNNKKAIVVGAGAGGLSAAVRLAHQGWDVTVLEKEAAPGGRLGAIEEAGYTFDIGPTIMMMDDVFRDFFAEVGRNIDDYLELVRLNPLYRLNYQDGTVMALPSDMKALLDEIRRINPDDVDGYLQFLSQIHSRYMAARKKFIEKPLNKLEEFLTLDTLTGMVQLKTLNNMYSDISRFIKDERLRIALTFQSIYLGISPFDAPSIYTIIAYVEHGVSGVWYPKGGMNAIGKALVRLLGEFGGKLRLNADVQSIVIEGGRARGVRLANGEELRADVVISNVDFPTSMETLIAPEHRGKYTPQKLESMTNSCGALMLYLGVNRRYENLDVHNIYFTRDYKETLDQIFEQDALPDDPAIYLYSPTRIDPSVAPQDKELIYVLVPVPNLSSGIDWETELPRFREKVIAKLERADLPDLRQHIEFEKIYTPHTFKQRFNLFQGAAFGLAPTLLQSGYFRPHISSDDVENLYFVGASVHPGGGVPVVMTCGKLAADLILKENGAPAVQWPKPAV
ncbi:phytoene desaturase [Heliobacterium gestii]|uniref:Phytoene desaturase n=1 Tax=Heliomicrobium gestii TaxID=2699 RepID=A0A845LAM5_HELGE|nr:phytoene desaturase family protein [Heliomicrobium gestii]MBM7865465.1 phytoene desaturase [Heliomicrobium gestii]MZP41719.1 phytoene desaturase [Heliomicrobium gestii]